MHKSDKIHAHTIMMHSVQALYCNWDCHWDCLRILGFYFSNSNLEERLIQAYKEDRWIFYEEGKPLSFENLDYYKRRRITDRLNNNIIREYMIQLGIDINTIDAQIKAGIVYVRKKW